MKPRDRGALEVFAIFLLSYALGISVAVIVVVRDDAPKKVIIQKQVVLGDEKKIITTFIDQLLTPKSAKCFKALLMRESHMNSKAKNPKSSAKGVGQLLDSTYRNIGMRHSDDALSQVVASLAYISRKFGSGGPCKAWRYWQENYSY